MATLKEILGNEYKDAMTVDEINAALSNKKLADLSTGEYVAKGKLNEYVQRTHDAEAKLAEKLTDEEKKQAEYEKREAHYKQIERENTLIKMRAKLASTIDDENVVNNVSELFANGDILGAIEMQNSYYANAKKSMADTIKAELLKSNPVPPPQNDTGLTKEAFNKMSYSERAELYNKNPDLYNKLNN